MLLTVHLPNGHKTEVTHTGSVHFFDKHEIHNVLYIHQFSYNLLSISKLTKELNRFVSFYPHFCLFQDLYTGKVKGIGKEKGGLYMLLSFTKPLSLSSALHSSSTFDSNLSALPDLCVWHLRLGHTPVDVI